MMIYRTSVLLLVMHFACISPLPTRIDWMHHRQKVYQLVAPVIKKITAFKKLSYLSSAAAGATALYGCYRWYTHRQVQWVHKTLDCIEAQYKERAPLVAAGAINAMYIKRYNDHNEQVLAELAPIQYRYVPIVEAHQAAIDQLVAYAESNQQDISPMTYARIQCLLCMHHKLSAFESDLLHAQQKEASYFELYALHQQYQHYAAFAAYCVERQVQLLTADDCLFVCTQYGTSIDTTSYMVELAQHVRATITAYDEAARVLMPYAEEKYPCIAAQIKQALTSLRSLHECIVDSSIYKKQAQVMFAYTQQQARIKEHLAHELEYKRSQAEHEQALAKLRHAAELQALESQRSWSLAKDRHDQERSRSEINTIRLERERLEQAALLAALKQRGQPPQPPRR